MYVSLSSQSQAELEPAKTWLLQNIDLVFTTETHDTKNQNKAIKNTRRLLNAAWPIFGDGTKHHYLVHSVTNTGMQTNYAHPMLVRPL